MKRYRILLLAPAQREYALALAWWRVNRHSSPRLLGIELRVPRKPRETHPEAGVSYHDGATARRILLPRTGYYVHCRALEADARIEILASWHPRRLPPVT